MNILYDFQIFSGQKYGGISRYFYELMSSFKKDKDVNYKLSLEYSNNYYIRNFNLSKHKNLLDGLNFRGKGRIINFLNKRKSKKDLLNYKYDVFHPTYYDPYFLDYIGDTPFVLTIHDMIHEIFTDYFSKKDKTIKNKKLLAKKAAKIIAVSENTKRDIINFYNIEEKKIEVIYHGNTFNSVNFKEKINIDIPGKYILYVGNRKAYKNFNFFIKAVSTILLEDKDLYLLCVGGGRFNKTEEHLFKQLNIDNKLIQTSVSDESLPYYYKNALVFVYPSLYEGFGLPILEAFSCGTPVVLSNSSCFPEVAGDAGVYFDPKDEDSIRSSIYKVIQSKELRECLSLRGFQQLKKFSWEKTASKTKKVYESAVYGSV